MDIAGLKKALDKNPKSLLFARLSDALRLAAGTGQKNEALAVVNKGLGVAAGFLPGKLARGRLLFENGDFAAAKIDFEAVAEQDPFCLSAQKLLLETLVVLEQQPKTGIYAKILNTIEPKVKVETNAQEIRKVVSATSAVPMSQSVFDALDSILDEEESNNETEVSSLLMQTFENIFGKILLKKTVDAPKAEKQPDLKIAPPAAAVVVAPSAPVASDSPAEKPVVAEAVAEKPAEEKAPDLTSELDSLLDDMPPEDSAPAASDSPAEKPAEEEPVVEEAAVEEAVAEKPAEEEPVAEEAAVEEAVAEKAPDLTSELDSLLDDMPPEDSAPAASDSPAEKPAEEEPVAEKAAPSIDDLIAEQLTPKEENLPDLTSELGSLLDDIPPEDSAPAVEKAVVEETVAEKPAEEEPVAEKAAPSIDDLIAEQLTPKEENLPDLTNELDSLLDDIPPEDSAPAASDSAVEKAAPSIDDLVAEQLVDKTENLPDLTGDMDSLLAKGLPPEEEEAPIAEKTAPSIDDLIAEQLVDKAENLPDLTSDMDSLLAKGLPPEEEEAPIAEKAAPSIDALIAEQLVDKTENLPDLTGDMDSLLAKGLPPEEDSVPEEAPIAEKAAPSIDDLIAEQLVDKMENLPDLTSDMDSLLAKGLPPEEEEEPIAEKAAPSIDALIAEQLVDKMENLPDLTSDMDSLLAKGLPPEEDSVPEEAPIAEKAAPSIDALIAEQLVDKMENLPDLTSDMDSLLAKGLPPEDDNEILAQNPTQTLAELYISQGLPQKAVAVYKELLARNPGNAELQAKLAIAQAKV
jgi:hypothetical protein